MKVKIKSFLQSVIGRNTTPVRAFCVMQSIVAVFAILADKFRWFVIDNDILVQHSGVVVLFAGVSALFGVLSFMNFHTMRHRMFGGISLIMGVIVNIMLIGYSLKLSPPLSLYAFTSPLIALWYLVAFLFIFEVEGYDGTRLA